MKIWLRFLGACLLATIAGRFASAQSQSVLTTEIRKISVSGGNSFGTPGGTASLSPNESYGPAGTALTISALAVGTFPPSGFTYTFFVNGTSIGTLPTPLQANVVADLNWTPPQPGSYFITVRATDGTNTSTSLPIRYFAIGTQIISPLNNTIVPVDSSLVLKADATSQQGFIQRIEFYVDGALVGSDSSAPYSYIYTPPSTITNHTVTAKAYDNFNQLVPGTPSSTIVMVPKIGNSPVVAISSPTNNSALAIPNYAQSTSANIPILVSANDADGVLSKVELYIDGVLFGTSTTFPYSFSWQPPVINQYNLVALAYDDKNNVTGSVPSTVRISAPPTISITSPANGGVVSSGAVTTIQANAGDSDGSVSKVQFFVDGKVIGEATTAPYSISWTPDAPTTKTDGTIVGASVTLTALATDDVGLSTQSTGVTLSVTTGGTSGGGVVGQPPTVAITSPLTSSQLPVNAPVTVTANASDPDGNIASVQFFVGTTSIGSDFTYPYSTTWTPSSLGTYTLTAKASDNSGNTVTSSSVVISVTDSSAGLPSVAITAPTNGSSFTVGSVQTIAATATDDGSIASVQFYVNGQLFGAPDTSFPYRATWTPSAIGSYTLLARATDNGGNQSVSTPVTVTITGGSAPSVALTSPLSNLSVALGTSVNVSAAASDSDGSIASVKFTANGVAVATVTTAPYSTTFKPSAAGVYSLVAQATDDVGNATDSTPVILTVLDGTNVPIVTLLNPASNTTISLDSSLLLAASADVGSGSISRVEFYAGSTLLTTLTTAPYSYVWRPSAMGTYAIRAVAYGNSGQGISSSVSTVSVGPRISNPGDLYVKIASPSNGSNVVLFRNITYIADTNLPASDNPQVDFYFNGNRLRTVTEAPFQTTFSFVNPGQVELYAVVRINGAVYTSAPVLFTVLPNSPPIVSLTSPTTGSSLTVGSAVTIKASASDPDDLIDSVKFLVNGQILSTSKAFPYTATWQPTSEGIYTIQAIAKDSQGSVGGNETTSAPIYVRVAAAAGSGGNSAPDTSYGGTYFSLNESGKFAVMNLGGKSAVFIGYSTSGTKKTYFYSGLPVDAGGGFSKTDSTGRVMVSGVTSAAGVSGELDNARLTFIGPITFPSGSTTVPSGYYTGNLSGKLDSTLNAIVGQDGSIMIAANSGSFTDAASGRLNANGTFSLTTAGGNLLTGKVDAATGLFTGTLGGSSGGAFTGALASGGTFSDGALRNLSTRGQVGTGANVLIAGFVIGGNSPKQVLIRAVGPSLTQYGVTNALADPQLSLFQGGTTIASNDNWGGSWALASAFAQSGAFALDASSKDAVVVATLNPGAYTAQVSGVGGTSGVAMIELYDRDAASAFSPQKMMNVSSRGLVGPGQGLLIAGFVVNGTVPKKILVRAIGPGLSTFNVSGFLADPILRVTRNDGVVMRENDNWEIGNDPILVSDANLKSGAFDLAAGSKDAVLLFSLPPGTYNAQVTGANNTGGLALVEVYEVP